MRFATTILMSIFLISACSRFTDESMNDPNELVDEQIQNDETNKNSAIPHDEEVDSSKEEEPSEEDLLISQLPADASLDDWNLILVNPWQALPEGYQVDLTEVDNEQQIDARAVEAWESWKQAALDAGHRLFFASGYRSIQRQQNNFSNSVQGYLNEGLSEEEAIEKTKEYLTEPGHSEHHTGLAFDIVDEEWIVAGNGLDPEYDTQPSQQWLVESMADYGFILRYPKGKEEITGIQYESWHFRYVGVENAQFIVKNDLVLEEYVDLLKMRDSD